jgi:hypothetical protein
MPFTKGHTKVGGRTKGIPNKSSEQKEVDRLLFGPEFRSAIKELTVARLTPLEVMHAVMFIKIGKGDYDGALTVAEKAAPFCHPKLNAAEVRVQHSLSARTDEELAAGILAIREKLALVQHQPAGAVIDLLPEHVTAGGETVDQSIGEYNDGGIPPAPG